MEFISPGRIEILGNHTDHNHGQVLVSTIELCTKASAEKTDGSTIFVKSAGYPDMTVDTGDTALRNAEAGSPLAVIKGVCEGFLRHGFKIGGFIANLGSDIPIGAGVSSSASYELIIAEILNCFYNDGRIPKIELAKIAQFSENVYMRKPCGLLDQAGIALGGVTHIDFFDIESPRVLELRFRADGYKIVIVSTGGDHSGLTAEYAAIKDEMRAVAKCFGSEYLSMVSPNAFFEAIPDIQKKVSGRAILRAAHFFLENERVERAKEAIEGDKLSEFFGCVKASGESSWKLLQNCYAEGDRAERIPLALYISSEMLHKGAYRVHGGGFRGTILAFAHESEAPAYIEKMSAVFGAKNVFVTALSPLGVRAV